MYHTINKYITLVTKDNYKNNYFINNNINILSSYCVPNKVVINKFDDPKNLIVRSFINKKFKLYEFIHYFQILYPIVIDENNILFNLFLWNYIGCEYTDTFNELLCKILIRIGCYGVFANSSFISEAINNVKEEKSYELKIDERFKLPHIKEHTHGWFSKDTKYNLKFALNYLKNKKNKTIIELGSWYGKSTRFILKNMNKEDTLICCDRFKNIMLSKYTMKNKSPGNDFYLNYPRVETFLKNTEKYRKDKEFYIYSGDIYDTMDLLFEKRNMKPDIVFVDFEKVEKYMLYVVNKIMEKSPQTIIVVDDMIYDPVKRAYNRIKYKKIKLKESFIVNIDKDEYFVDNNIITHIKNMNFIEANSLDIIVKKFGEEYIAVKMQKIIENGEYKKIVDYIDYVDLNKQYDTLDLKNTLYHYIVFYIRYDKNMKGIEKLRLLNKFIEKQQIINNINKYDNVPLDYLVSKPRID